MNYKTRLYGNTGYLMKDEYYYKVIDIVTDRYLINYKIDYDLYAINQLQDLVFHNDNIDANECINYLLTIDDKDIKNATWNLMFSYEICSSDDEYIDFTDKAFELENNIIDSLSNYHPKITLLKNNLIDFKLIPLDEFSIKTLINKFNEYKEEYENEIAFLQTLKYRTNNTIRIGILKPNNDIVGYIVLSTKIPYYNNIESYDFSFSFLPLYNNDQVKEIIKEFISFIEKENILYSKPSSYLFNKFIENTIFKPSIIEIRTSKYYHYKLIDFEDIDFKYIGSNIYSNIDEIYEEKKYIYSFNKDA